MVSNPGLPCEVNGILSSKLPTQQILHKPLHSYMTFLFLIEQNFHYVGKTFHFTTTFLHNDVLISKSMKNSFREIFKYFPENNKRPNTIREDLRRMVHANDCKRILFLKNLGWISYLFFTADVLTPPDESVQETIYLLYVTEYFSSIMPINCSDILYYKRRLSLTAREILILQKILYA